MKSIIMSTEDVRSVLDGRKKMARQVVKFKNGSNPFWSGYTPDGAVLYGGNNVPAAKSPYQAGDVLWVRETWAKNTDYANPALYIPHGFIHKATGEYHMGVKWRSPVTMPREAARLFLRVKDVRVERVQDISAEDCEAEGYFETAPVEPRPRSWFSAVWDARNAKRGYGWDSNPWVWVIGFEKCDPE